MVENILRTSALSECYDPNSTINIGKKEIGVVLAERSPLSIVHISGKPNDLTFVGGVKKVCGCVLPQTSGTFLSSGKLSLIWIAPARWLVVTHDMGPNVLENRLRDNCGEFASVTDVSHGRTVIRISGENSRQVLMKGAPLDFHPKIFKRGQSASTSISQCGVLLTCLDDNEFDLYVLRGFGQHMWEWVCDAATEYGYKVAPIISS